MRENQNGDSIPVNIFKTTIKQATILNLHCLYTLTKESSSFLSSSLTCFDI